MADTAKLSKLQYVSFLLFVFSLPFYRSISSPILVISLVIAITLWIADGRPRLEINWFLLTLFFYYVASAVIAADSLASIEKRFPLLVVPLLVSLITRNFVSDAWRSVFLAFIAGNFIAAATCVSRALIRSLSINDGAVTFDARVIQDSDYDFFSSSVMGGNYFFSDQLSMFQHPSYFGLLLVFAQMLISVQDKYWHTRKSRLLMAGVFFFFSITIFLLSSKAIIFSSIAVTVVALVRIRLPLRNKVGLAAFIVGFLTITFALNPRVSEFRETLDFDKAINPEARFGHELRIMSWQAAYEIISENLWFGVGESNKEEALVTEYLKKGYVVPAQEKFNSHNMYLDFMLGGGLALLLCVLTSIFMMLIKAFKFNDIVLISFLLLFGFNGIFENLLSRYWGMTFFALFLSLLSVKLSKSYQSGLGKGTNAVPE